MELEVLGTNSAFVKNGVNNSFILWRSADDGILLDCGYSVFQELRNKDYAGKVNTVLLSHQHQDHAGSAVTLVEYRNNVLGKKTAVGGAWEKLLQTADGIHAAEMTQPPTIKLETFTVPHAKGLECLALFIENSLLYSGDSAVSILDTTQARQAKMIIHDVSLTGGAIVKIDELGKAAPEIKAKTYVSHYRPQDYEELCRRAAKAGLAGVLQPGNKFNLAP